MAARKWMPEQQRHQSMLIRTWSPWTRSTGPPIPAGKLSASHNAYRGGLRSKLKALSKEVNDLLREQSDFLRSIYRGFDGSTLSEEEKLPEA